MDDGGIEHIPWEGLQNNQTHHFQYVRYVTEQLFFTIVTNGSAEDGLNRTHEKDTRNKILNVVPWRGFTK